jgi:hypothetical protein
MRVLEFHAPDYFHISKLPDQNVAGSSTMLWKLDLHVQLIYYKMEARDSERSG